MIIDFHTHVFPPQMCEHRKNFFPGEPAFELLYNSGKSKLIGVRELIESMDRNGIDMSVVFGFPWTDPGTCKQHNDYILDAVAKYPNRLKGLCCVDPTGDGAVNEAVRCLDQGLSGVGELAFYQTGIDEDAVRRLSPLMKICRERHLPVLIHSNEPVGHAYPGKTPITLPQIFRLINTFPKNNIVLAHWGGGIFFYHLLKKEIKESLINVYFDTAASPFLYEPAIYDVAVRIIGPEKILFGSDYPLLPPKRYFKEVCHTALSMDDTRLIYGDNAAGLLNIQ